MSGKDQESTATTNPTTNSVFAALNAVMNDVLSVRKDDRNVSQGFNFRGIDAVMNAVGPSFRKHGIVCVPMLNGYDFRTVEVGKNATKMGHIIADVTYRFYGPVGDHIEARVIGEAMDAGDKAVSKAMSVALRIALLQSLTMPTDESDPDDDVYERTAEADKPPMGWAAVVEAYKQYDTREAVMTFLGGADSAEAALAAYNALSKQGKGVLADIATGAKTA